MILKKKNMSNMDLVRAINEVEEQAGVKEKTCKQNVTNYLNDYFNWGYEFTRKVEVALKLEDEMLLKFLPQPKGNIQRKKYMAMKEKWQKVEERK